MRERRKEKESERKIESEQKERMEKEERKQRKKVSFYAKASEIKSAFYAEQPLLVLLYKEVCLNTNELKTLWLCC